MDNADLNNVANGFMNFQPYWDLKEKYDQLEKNHEHLQQNMANLQMQLETVAGQYQEEQRLHSETSNKLAAFRKLSDMLGGYLGRQEAKLERSQQDNDRSAGIVRELAAKHTKFAEDCHRDKAALEDKCMLVSERCAQLSRELGATRQSAVAEQRAMLARLAQAQARNEELSRELDGKKRDLEVRDQDIATLQGEMQRLTLEGSSRCAEPIV